MSWSILWRIVGPALFAIALVLAVRRHGWRRGMLRWLGDLARAWLIVGPIAIAGAFLGTTASWCAVPVVLAAQWFGQSTLGILNFLLLQWFGVRLARSLVVDVSDVPVTVLGQDERSVDRLVAAGVGDGRARSYWFLLRWVWPLTGWWSEYRWIARRGGAR